MLNRVTTICIVILAGILISGCLMQLAYNNSDRLIAWKVDDYFDLHRTQKQFIRESIRNHLNWHRREQLHQYVVFLDDVQKRVERGLVLADVDWFFDTLYRFRTHLVDALLEDTTAFLVSIDDAQMQYLYAELEGSNRELAKDLTLSAKERLEHRVKTMRKIVERWTGRLAREQRRDLEVLADEFPDTIDRWYTYQRGREATFEQLVLRARQQEDIAQPLRDWLLARSSEAFPDFHNVLRETIISVDRMLTPIQRKRVSNELSELREDLIDLVTVETPHP